MLLKTHLAITLFFILLLINSVEDKFIFVVVALAATYIPDIDTRYSKLGHKKLARVLQWFTKHRGMIHSFTFLLSLTVLLVLFIPVIALGFFLGYGLHLFADAFTREGIRPFYPWKKRAKGPVRTGSRVETSVFVGFIIADLAMLAVRVF